MAAAKQFVAAGYKCYPVLLFQFRLYRAPVCSQCNAVILPSYGPFHWEGRPLAAVKWPVRSANITILGISRLKEARADE